MLTREEHADKIENKVREARWQAEWPTAWSAKPENTLVRAAVSAGGEQRHQPVFMPGNREGCGHQGHAEKFRVLVLRDRPQGKSGEPSVAVDGAR